MTDQFSEWDRFYAAYKRSESPEGAFQRYRKGRKRRKVSSKYLTPQQKMQLAYEKRIEERRVQNLKDRADELVRESVAKASKGTT